MVDVYRSRSISKSSYDKTVVTTGYRSRTMLMNEMQVLYIFRCSYDRNKISRISRQKRLLSVTREFWRSTSPLISSKLVTSSLSMSRKPGEG